MQDKLLTLTEAAVFLGMSPTALYSARYNGADLPPSIKFGNKVRYRKPDLDRWIDEHTEQPRKVPA